MEEEFFSQQLKRSAALFVPSWWHSGANTPTTPHPPPNEYKMALLMHVALTNGPPWRDRYTATIQGKGLYGWEFWNAFFRPGGMPPLGRDQGGSSRRNTDFVILGHFYFARDLIKLFCECCLAGRGRGLAYLARLASRPVPNGATAAGWGGAGENGGSYREGNDEEFER